MKNKDDDCSDKFISVKLTEYEIELLQKLADSMKVSRLQLIRQAIIEGVDKAMKEKEELDKLMEVLDDEM